MDTQKKCSSVWLSEISLGDRGPSPGKELLILLTVHVDCMLSIGTINYFPFSFKGRILVVTVLVPGHCLYLYHNGGFVST